MLQRRVGDCLHSLESERWLDAISAMVRAALCRPWVRGQSLDESSAKCAPQIFLCRVSTADHSCSRQHLRFSPCCPGTHFASPQFSVCGLFRLPEIPPLACLTEPQPWLQRCQPPVPTSARTALPRPLYLWDVTTAPGTDMPSLPVSLTRGVCAPPCEARLLCSPLTASPPHQAVLFSCACVCALMWGPLHTSARNLLIAGSSPSSLIIPKE